VEQVSREHFMSLAIELAKEAAENGEVPVGCVVVDKEGKVVGRGRNRRIEKNDATAHAEMEAIREASAYLKDWRLEGCTMYVTLEPCPMCAGAIIMSRVSTVVFGAREAVTGSVGSVIDLFSEKYGHSPAVFTGVCAEKCLELMRSFFEGKRR